MYTYCCTIPYPVGRVYNIRKLLSDVTIETTGKFSPTNYHNYLRRQGQIMSQVVYHCWLWTALHFSCQWKIYIYLPIRTSVKMFTVLGNGLHPSGKIFQFARFVNEVCFVSCELETSVINVLFLKWSLCLLWSACEYFQSCLSVCVCLCLCLCVSVWNFYGLSYHGQLLPEVAFFLKDGVTPQQKSISLKNSLLEWCHFTPFKPVRD